MGPRCKSCIYPEYRPSGIELPVVGFLLGWIRPSGSRTARPTLEPVCRVHKGECRDTFVLLDDGIGEWAAEAVLME